MFNIQQRGAEAVDAKLAKLRNKDRELESAARQAVLYVQSQVPPYPAPPATSDYRRTGLLGRSLTGFGSSAGPALSRVESIGGKPAGIVGSAVEYAPGIIDEERQEWMHQGRWWTLQEVVRKSRDGIVRIYQDTIGKLTR